MKQLSKEQLKSIGKNNSLTFKVRSNSFESSNCSFDLENLKAFSYSWWCFYEVINGKGVFNWFSYSNTTSKHQNKVYWLLKDLGLNIDFEIKSPRGLQDLNSSIEFYENEINDLENLIKKPKTHKVKNEKRKLEIKELKRKLKQVKILIIEQKKAV